LLRIISGAKYSGVPHNVQVLPLTLLANPKSVTYKRKKILVNIYHSTINVIVVPKLKVKNSILKLKPCVTHSGEYAHRRNWEREGNLKLECG
jgi:hypothetical protein